MNNITFFRNSILLLPYSLIVLTRQYTLFFIVLFSIGNTHKESLFFKIVIIISTTSLILNILKIFVHWTTFKYSIGDENLYIKDGLFFKKKTKIPFNKIQNVTEKTPFTFKILKNTSLKLDLGIDNDDGKIELKMIRKSECNTILEKISCFSGKEKQEEKKKKQEGDVIYKITNKELVIMSITSLKLVFFIPFLMSIYSDISEYFGSDFIDSYIDKIMNSITLWALVLVILFFLSLIYGYVITYIKFGNFSVRKDYDQIYIKNGIINRNAKALPHNKIVALIFKTNILFDFLNYHKVSAVTLGERFSAEPNSNVIFPFIKKPRTNILLGKVLSNLLGTIQLKKLSWKSGILNTISYLPLIAITAVLLCTRNSFKDPYSLIGFMCIFLILYHCFKQSQKKYGVNYNKKILQIQLGFLVKKTYTTNFDNIEQIIIQQNLIQKCFGTCSLVIYIKTNQTQCFKIPNILYDECKEIYNTLTNQYNNIESLYETDLIKAQN